MTELSLTAEPPSKFHMRLMTHSAEQLKGYQTVLDLDLKVRQKPLPASLDRLVSPEDGECTPSEYMHSCVCSVFRSVS